MKTTRESAIPHPENVLAGTASSPVSNASQSVTSWIPRSWRDEVMGCVFLPRMLEKGRRALESERQGRDLMDGFLFGDFDYADGMMLRFLRTNEVRVRELLRDHDDDESVASILFSEGRRSPDEVKAWSRYFRRINALFTPMWDADEGRREPGIGTSLLSGFYNYLMMPPVYLCFRMMTAKRRRRQAAG